MPIAPTTKKESAKLIASSQKELGSALDSFYEKIAFYSAGSLSLSITFLGYISSWTTNPLRYSSFIGLPVYYILLFSWVTLFLSMIFSLYMRLFFSESLLHQVWKAHIRLQLKETEDAYISGTIHSKNGEATINNTGLTADKFIKENESKKKSYEKLLTKYNFKEAFFNFIVRKHKMIVVPAFILGIFFSLSFAFIVFYKR